MYISTNQLMTTIYLDETNQLCDKYIRYIRNWRDRLKDEKAPTFFNIGFYFGRFDGIGSNLDDELITDELWFNLVEEIANQTPCFDYSLSHFSIHPDPVAGYLLYAIPDQNAVNIVTNIYQQLRDSKYGKYIYIEGSEYLEFVTGSRLMYLRYDDEAKPIAKYLNKLDLSKIKGNVDVINLLYSDGTKIKSFKLKDCIAG